MVCILRGCPPQGAVGRYQGLSCGVASFVGIGEKRVVPLLLAPRKHPLTNFGVHLQVQGQDTKVRTRWYVILGLLYALTSGWPVQSRYPAQISLKEGCFFLKMEGKVRRHPRHWNNSQSSSQVTLKDDGFAFTHCGLWFDLTEGGKVCTSGKDLVICGGISGLSSYLNVV